MKITIILIFNMMELGGGNTRKAYSGGGLFDDDDDLDDYGDIELPEDEQLFMQQQLEHQMMYPDGIDPELY